jgi:RHS repeat-associated protein
VYLERTSGPATTFAYHGPGSNFGRLSLIRHGTAGDAYPDYSYSGYDSVGNLTGVTVTNANAGSYAYTYDDLNRLATATLSGAGAADFSYTYSYNRLGNLMGRTGTDPDMTYTYGAGSAGPQAVTSITRSVGGNLAFTYDPRGNMDGQFIGGTLVYDYTFDVEGHLASVMTNNQTTTFAYDADGQRVMTTRPDGTIIYTPFPDYELEDPPGANNDTTRTTYRLAGQMVGVRVKTPTGNTFYYPFVDHLGNVVAMSWRGAGVVPNSHARYDPFGNFRTTPTATNPSLTSRGFTGHAHNNTGVYPTQNVGLIYMNARYYLPEVGRFVSPDSIVPEPTNPQAYNRYSYAVNNPIKYNDPSGHWFESALDLAFIAYDIYDIRENGLSWTNGVSLVVDMGGLALPVVTGGGLIVRAVSHGDEFAKIAAHAGDFGPVKAAVEALKLGDAKLLEKLPDWLKPIVRGIVSESKMLEKLGRAR